MASELKEKIRDELGISGGSLSGMKTGEVSPGENPLVFIHKNDALVPENITWGIEGPNRSLIINARSETVFEKKMFCDGILHRRCIVPASLFYEWDGDRTKVAFSRPDGNPIYLAGFYDDTKDGKRFVILTTSPNESMKDIHDRMPLIMDKDEVAAWLGDERVARKLLGKKGPVLNNDRKYEQLNLFDFM
ncbi:MAG: SOS response-associated peptidase [Lachnospiraceae bacterium]|nr:SOS response-associated peptidase [Lachnospiraceae bacterium]